MLNESTQRNRRYHGGKWIFHQVQCRGSISQSSTSSKIVESNTCPYHANGQGVLRHKSFKTATAVSNKSQIWSPVLGRHEKWKKYRQYPGTVPPII